MGRVSKGTVGEGQKTFNTIRGVKKDVEEFSLRPLHERRGMQSLS